MMDVMDIEYQWPQWLTVAIVVAVGYRTVNFLGSAMRSSDYPPGPPTLPGIGNIHQVPMKQPFLKFTEWAKTYGPIIGLKVGSANIVVLNDAAFMHELFNKRGNIYSGRKSGYIPTKHVFGEYLDIHVLGMQYGPFLRKWRTSASHLLNSPGVKETRPMQESTAAKLCVSLLQATTHETHAHLKHWALSTPLIAITGQRLEDRGQAFADRFFLAQKHWTQLLEPGNAPPVDVITPLRWVPECWAEWKRKAAYVRAYMVDEYFGYLEAAKSLQKSSKGSDSFRSLMTRVLEDESKETNDNVRFQDAEIAYFGGPLVDAAVDTTLAILGGLIMFLATHPEAQAKAFAEIEKLDPLAPPTSESMANLPYLKACLLEIYRLRPPAPSVPHFLDQDDVFQGYRIPKGTLLLGNVWAMQQDPDFYDEPGKFIPEQYIKHPLGLKGDADAEGRKSTYAFGAGRRACPGEQFANTSILIAMAKILWAYEIIPAGEIDLSPETGYHDGLVLHPREFKVQMKLRDEKKRAELMHDYETSLAALYKVGH